MITTVLLPPPKKDSGSTAAQLSWRWAACPTTPAVPAQPSLNHPGRKGGEGERRWLVRLRRKRGRGSCEGEEERRKWGRTMEETSDSRGGGAAETGRERWWIWESKRMQREMYEENTEAWEARKSGEPGSRLWRMRVGWRVSVGKKSDGGEGDNRRRGEVRERFVNGGRKQRWRRAGHASEWWKGRRA